MNDRRERPNAAVSWPDARPSSHSRRDPESSSESRTGEVDRRNNASRAALVERFRAEFRDMPGLWVTRAEARRLFGVPEDICGRVLDSLVSEGLLVRTADGIYR